MRVVIAGATGYIGSAAARTLLAEGAEVTRLARRASPGFDWLDLGDPASFGSVAVHEGAFILLAAGISAPDACAREPDRVRRINVTGTAEYIALCLSRGARVIFCSSDTVYGERSDDVYEEAVCAPLGAYALMKNEVEQRFVDDPAFKTVRLSYVFSRDDKFTRHLAGCSRDGVEAEVFDPFCRAVVHRDDVVAGLTALMRRWDSVQETVVNFAGPDVLSRSDFVQMLKDTALPDLRFRTIQPEPDFFLNRPRIIRMKSRFFASLLQRPARALADAMRMEFGSPSGERNG